MPEMDTEETKEENAEPVSEENQTATETVTEETSQPNTETQHKSEKSETGSHKSDKKTSEKESKDKKDKHSDSKKSEQKTEKSVEKQDSKTEDDSSEESTEKNDSYQDSAEETTEEETEVGDSPETNDQAVDESNSTEEPEETISEEDAVNESETVNYNNENNMNKEENIMPENTNEEQNVNQTYANATPESSQHSYTDSESMTPTDDKLNNEYAEADTQVENINETVSDAYEPTGSQNEASESPIPFPITEKENPTETVADSKTYTINGKEYSEEDISAMRDELASRTAQEQDVSQETARNALDNGKYAEGYASDHPDELTEETETDTPKQEVPDNPAFPKSTIEPLSDNIGIQPDTSATDNMVIQTGAGTDIDPGMTVNPPTGVGNGFNRIDWITQDDEISPENMSTEELQEIVASADAVDGRGTKESNIKALQGDYWQYADEPEDQTAKEDEDSVTDENEDNNGFTDTSAEDENTDEDDDMPHGNAPDGHVPDGHGPYPDPGHPGQNPPETPFMGDNGFNPMYHTDEEMQNTVMNNDTMSAQLDETMQENQTPNPTDNNTIGAQIVNGVEQAIPNASIVIPMGNINEEQFGDLQSILNEITNTDETSPADKDLNALTENITNEPDEQVGQKQTGTNNPPSPASGKQVAQGMSKSDQAVQMFGNIDEPMEEYESEEEIQAQ